MVENRIHLIDSCKNLRCSYVDHYKERDNLSLAVALQGVGEKVFLYRRVDDEVSRLEIRSVLIRRVLEI